MLSRKGQAVGLSQDQKPHLFSEWERIQKAGGYIDEEGFLNGQLAVSRAIGDWHLEGMKKKKDGTPGPLIADPDINVHLCEKDDEFVLLGETRETSLPTIAANDFPLTLSLFANRNTLPISE